MQTQLDIIKERIAKLDETEQLSYLHKATKVLDTRMEFLVEQLSGITLPVAVRNLQNEIKDINEYLVRKEEQHIKNMRAAYINKLQTGLFLDLDLDSVDILDI